MEEREAPAVEVVKRALAEAKRQNVTAIIIDTVGAVSLDDDTADALAALADEVDPTEVLIVVDAMSGQEAVTIAKEFDEAIEGTGIVVTKVDSDSRGGAVLSVREVTGLPIKLITTGERLEALEDFHPDRFASRVLGMGDVVSLVEKAAEAVSKEDAAKLEEKMRRGEFTLEDFLEQLRQMKQLGSLEKLVGMLPGVSGQMKDIDFAKSEREFRRMEGIICAMTRRERSKPQILNAKRRIRIAKGSGVTVSEVNNLLNRFSQMQQMMKKMGKFQKMMGRMGGMMPGMMR